MPDRTATRLSLPRRRGWLLAVSVSVLVVSAVVGLALAKTLTKTLNLRVAGNAHVSNVAGKTTRQAVVVTTRGFAVYTLSGDSRRHPKCTQHNGCFGFWPPVKASSAKHLRADASIKGKLGSWRRDGFVQLTLKGHPLYRFSQDSKRNRATGEGIHTFGGTWHVRTPSGRISSGTAPKSPPQSPGTTSTATSSTTTVPYPSPY
ncbi:MAG: hypothetical protein M3016_01050 [Actinomycetota bacterium]|nr:hypothetical protein [Actinomycetota bacterium]